MFDVHISDSAWSRGVRKDGKSYVDVDATIAMDHLILAAENEGIGTCWIENYDPVVLRKALNLSDNQVVFSITPLGYQKPGFKKAGNKKRKPLNEVLEWL